MRSTRRIVLAALAVVVGLAPGCGSSPSLSKIDDALPIATGVGTMVTFAVGVPVCALFAPITIPLSSHGGDWEALLVPGLVLGLPCGVVAGLPFTVIDLLTLPFRHIGWRSHPEVQHHYAPSPSPVATVAPVSTADADWPVASGPRPEATPPEAEDGGPDPLDAIVPCPHCGKPARTEELRCPGCPECHTTQPPPPAPVVSILSTWDTPAPPAEVHGKGPRPGDR